MSVANYNASVFEHIQIQVCVHYGSNTSANLIKFIEEKLGQHTRLVINDAGCAINVRYEVDAPVQNTSWGHFQAHRQVLGLIHVAEAVTPMEAALVQDKFNKKKEEYGSGLYHSRCLIFGVDTIRHTHGQDVFRFSSEEAWKSADYDIKEMITAIFYDLESKRLKMTLEKTARPPLIRAGFEILEADNDKFEPDSKNYRKRCIGRHNKHLGDVNLLAGQLLEALLCYHSAVDMLSSVNDTVWMGAALEGLCVASSQVLFPDASLEKKAAAKDDNTNQVLDPRNLLNKRMSAPNPGELRKLCIPTIDDLVDRYKEAIIHYSRSKSLGIIEMEACIKATKVVAKSKKYLEASEFLQNAIYITLNLPDDERIKRYSVLADLYNGIGFSRKSSFYKRVAAMQCVAPQLQDPDWKLCNSLLMRSLSGYGIRLEEDCSDALAAGYNDGWPNIRLRVLHELVFSSEKIGNHKLANRHMMFLLIKMFRNLTEAEEKDVCTALENFLRKSKGTSMSDVSAGSALPDLTLYILPVVKNVTPLSLANEAKPVKAEQSDEPESVFIYKPTSYMAENRGQQKAVVTWCVNTACTVNIVVHNPLTYATLQISKITLITDASTESLHCQPITVSLAPNKDKEVKLIATPSVSGTMKIIGYEISVFGFVSKCYFTNIAGLSFDVITVEVIQELPLLKCASMGQARKDKIVFLTTYLGEKYSTAFSLSNVGQCKVQDLKMSVKAKPKDILCVTIIDPSAKLPLEPHRALPLKVILEPKSLTDQAKHVRCIISVRYAGHITENMWWRSVDIELDVEVKMCIALNTLTVQSKECDPRCSVVCTVENCSEEEVEVDCKSVHDTQNSATASLKPKACGSLVVTMDKVPLLSVPSGTECVEDFCLSYLRENVNLTWVTISNREDPHRGATTFSETMSRASVCNMLESPMECELWFDTNAVTSHNERFEACLGKPSNVSFQLSNKTTESWEVEVHLQIFQDQCNGYVEFNLTESVLCIGSVKASLVMKSSELWKHECTLVFLRSGSFTVQVTYHITLPDKLAFGYTSPRKRITYKSYPICIDA